VGGPSLPGGWSGRLGTSTALFGRWTSFRVLLRGGDDGRVDAWQGALTASVAGAHVTLERETGLQDEDLTTVRVFQAFPSGRRRWLRDVAVSLAGGVAAGRAALGEAGLTLRPGGAGVLSARLRLRRGQEPAFSLSWSVRAPFGLLHARSVSGPGASRFVGAEGGMALHARGVVATPSDAVGRSGVVALVFQDLDGDGARGVDEPRVAGVDVRVGSRTIRTDAAGAAHTWELLPYEVVRVDVEPLSVEIGWSPPAEPIALRPAPNAFVTVELPLQRTREVSGRVWLRARGAGGARPDSTTPLGGATLLVLAGADVVARARTFEDGVFYVPDLRPGDYELTLDETSERVVGIDTAPRVPLRVPAVGDEVVEAPDLVVGSDPPTLNPRS
jgi:hypothetical protein